MINTFPPIDVEKQKFLAVGRCIYCGSDGDEDGLRDEHIVPYALGANAILPKASCRNCEAVTSYLDGYLARSVYYDLRLQMGVQSRRKNKPTTRPATISDGTTDQVFDFKLKDHPHFIHLPIWSRPGIMYGDQPTIEFAEQSLMSFFQIPGDFWKNSDILPDASIKSTPKINLQTFARAIAKIGYVSAIAHLRGIEFRPLFTPAIILGRYPYVSHFVGTDFSNEVEPPDAPHVRHKIEYGLWEHGRLALIRMKIRLFSDCGSVAGHGMPSYEVLVGALRGSDARAKLIPQSR